MAIITSGTFPVFNNVFKIKTSGTSETAVMSTIKDLETFSVAFDNNIETWTPMDQEGWSNSQQTGKSLSITFSGKRSVGDTGNDYVAGLAFKTGQDVETEFEWDLPTGETIKFDCLVSVTNMGGGDSTNVAGLEFEVKCKGKPTVTAA